MSETRTVTSIQARKSILQAFKVKRPIFLWGPPGIGKSELVEGISQELGGIMYDLRLGQMEPTDIRGIPFYNKDTGKMDWAAPVDLPDEETASQYPIVVLFMDELNSAPPSVQSAAYQLILNRRIGKYVLPDNVVMVDGFTVGDIQDVVLRDRQILSEDGIFVVVAMMNPVTGRLIKSPDIISRGSVYLRESQDLLREIRTLVRTTIERNAHQMRPINIDYIKDLTADTLGKFIFQETAKRPIIIPVVLMV